MNCKDGNDTILFYAMIHAWMVIVRSFEGIGLRQDPLTVSARREQTFAPFNIGLPPHALPVAASSCPLNEPIPTNVIPVGNNHVSLRCWFLFRRAMATRF